MPRIRDFCIDYTFYLKDFYFRLPSNASNFKLPAGVNNRNGAIAPSHLDHRAPPPELNTIHRALFSDRKKSGAFEIGTKPLFTVTMPKKGDLNNRQNYN